MTLNDVLSTIENEFISIDEDKTFSIFDDEIETDGSSFVDDSEIESFYFS